jgi:transcription elongation GreA/GreB family factor
MLGLHTGDRAQIQLPGGKVEIEVLSIEPTKLT